jgi:hypothetical protein
MVFASSGMEPESRPLRRSRMGARLRKTREGIGLPIGRPVGNGRVVMAACVAVVTVLLSGALRPASAFSCALPQWHGLGKAASCIQPTSVPERT